MTEKEDLLRERVLEIMPDIQIERFEINQEGLVNDVAIVNQAFVFRFTKNERGARILEKEMQVLALLHNRLDVQIPTPITASADSIVYPYLAGIPLTREIILGLDKPVQTRVANQLGGFLNALHNTDLTNLDRPLPETAAPATREKCINLYNRVREKVYPLLLNHQIEWAENLFKGVLADSRSFLYRPVLIHADLAPYHILFNDSTKKINAVLDFGVAGVGDAAMDIGNLITTYGERFVSKFRPAYPQFEEHLPKARYHAQRIELEWVLLGIESEEKFWFTAHIGGARDIQA